MQKLNKLQELLQQHFADKITLLVEDLKEITIEVAPENLHSMCLELRNNPALAFNMLIDVCGVDYLKYGLSEWQTERTTTTGFSRAVDRSMQKIDKDWEKPRFAVVYHLLSLTHNWRLRIRTYPVAADPLIVDSVTDIWPAANWFEREAFDMFGIIFNNHPDLRRILTDYGFIGHPFRKDFPLIGQVEMRYDAASNRCIYEPVSINPRTLVPKVIRDDKRYLVTKPNADNSNV